MPYLILVSDRDLFQNSWWVLTGDGDGQIEAYVSQIGSTPEMNDKARRSWSIRAFLEPILDQRRRTANSVIKYHHCLLSYSPVISPEVAVLEADRHVPQGYVRHVCAAHDIYVPLRSTMFTKIP